MSIEMKKKKTSNFVLITLFSLIYEFGTIRYGNAASEVSFSSPLKPLEEKNCMFFI